MRTRRITGSGRPWPSMKGVGQEICATAEAARYSRRDGTSNRADLVRYCLGGKYSGGAGRVTKRPFPAFSETVRAALELAKRRGRPSASRPGLSGQYGETYGRNNIAQTVGATLLFPYGAGRRARAVPTS